MGDTVKDSRGYDDANANQGTIYISSRYRKQLLTAFISSFGVLGSLINGEKLISGGGEGGGAGVGGVTYNRNSISASKQANQNNTDQNMFCFSIEL